jgi:hypothetical protein
MKQNLEKKSIEQLLAEADELNRQFTSDVHKDMKEEHHRQFAAHARNLEKIKSQVQEKEKTASGSGSGGIHSAILDIVKAMHGLKKDLT